MSQQTKEHHDYWIGPAPILLDNLSPSDRQWLRSVSENGKYRSESELVAEIIRAFREGYIQLEGSGK